MTRRFRLDELSLSAEALALRRQVKLNTDQEVLLLLTTEHTFGIPARRRQTEETMKLAGTPRGPFWYVGALTDHTQYFEPFGAYYALPEMRVLVQRVKSLAQRGLVGQRASLGEGSCYATERGKAYYDAIIWPNVSKYRQFFSWDRELPFPANGPKPTADDCAAMRERQDEQARLRQADYVARAKR